MSNPEMKRSRSKAVPKTRTAVVRMAVSGIAGLGTLAYGVLKAIDTGLSNWVGVVMPLVGLFLLVLAVLAFRDLRLAREMDSSGEITEGVIVGKRSTTDSEGDRTRYLAYEFGEGFGAEQQVGAAVYRQLEIGDTVEVCYLPRDPNVSRMEI